MGDERVREVLDSSSHDMILGEMRGQLREVVHGQANLAMKFDALTREVIGLGSLATDLAEQKLASTALAARVDALEAEKSRREGAYGVVQAIAKSPVVAWTAAIGAAAWAFLTGKVSL